MSLLETFLNILSEWKSCFSKKPSYCRATALAIASLCVFGRGCISRIICFMGLEHKDWSAHYKLFARSKWMPGRLFQSIVSHALPMIDQSYISVAFDDTKLKKTGKKIKTAFYQRDPLSPPFHVNLFYGLRFLQASLIMPLYHKNDQPPRGLPISFKEVPALKKPGKHATEDEMQEYKKNQKLFNLSNAFRETLAEVRASLDEAGACKKTLIAVVDGSFCNSTCMRSPLERTCIVARTRKDAKLCFKAKEGSKKIYDDVKFTPEQVRQDDSLPWQTTSIYHGGRWREVRYKEVKEVLWQTSTRLQFLRLIVIAPTPYRLTKQGKQYYRQPAYLLCQHCELASEILIQNYFDRWQIEVNHREEKDTLGVGQGQVRSEKSVERQPAFVVVAYSALLLAGIICFDDKRTESFQQLPKWRGKSTRPSCLDLMQMLRKEVSENEKSPFRINLKEAALKSAA